MAQPRRTIQLHSHSKGVTLLTAPLFLACSNILGIHLLYSQIKLSAVLNSSFELALKLGNTSGVSLYCFL